MIEDVWATSGSWAEDLFTRPAVQAVGKTNVGGLAGTRILTLAEIGELYEAGWREAFDMAEERAAKQARIRGCGHTCWECQAAELRSELASVRHGRRRMRRPRGW